MAAPRLLRPLAVLTLLVAGAVTPSRLPAQRAVSWLITFDADFNLTDTQGVRWLGGDPDWGGGPPGTGGPGLTDAWDNDWYRITRECLPHVVCGPYDPADPDAPYRFALANGPVVADAPPVPPGGTAEWWSTIVGFAQFYNFADDTAHIAVHWSALEYLSVEGNTARASFAVLLRNVDHRTNQVLGEDDSFADELSSPPDDWAFYHRDDDEGVFDVKVPPAYVDGARGRVPGQTLFGAGAENRAVATAAPEPGTLALLGGGLAACALARRRRRA